MKQIKMVRVSIDRDSAYDYIFVRGAEQHYRMQIQVSEDVIERWEAIEKAYKEMQRELKSFYEKGNK